MSAQSRRAVAAIIYDLEDRRGLKHEWRQIDPEIQQEIREVWEKILDREFRTDQLEEMIW